MAVFRRAALQRIAAAGAGIAIAPAILRGQSSAITVAGKPVEVSIVPISRSTVRITVRPIINGKPQAITGKPADIVLG